MELCMLLCNECGCEFMAEIKSGTVKCPECGKTDEMIVDEEV